MITQDMLAQLRGHFAGGRDAVPDTAVPNPHPPVVSAALHVTEITIPPCGDGYIVATDGSAGLHLGTDVHHAGCAAAAADGRVLVSWFEVPEPVGEATTYAEWQGARLGLRLSQGWPASRLLIDNETVAGQLQRIINGRRAGPRILGFNDPQAMDEVCRLARAVPVNATWLANPADDALTGRVALARTAHAAAWLIRRLVADGFDPEAHADWLALIISRTPRRRDTLRETYLRRFNPSATHSALRRGRRAIVRAVEGAGGSAEHTAEGGLRVTGPAGHADVPLDLGHQVRRALRTIQQDTGLPVTPATAAPVRRRKRRGAVRGKAGPGGPEPTAGLTAPAGQPRNSSPPHEPPPPAAAS